MQVGDAIFCNQQRCLCPQFDLLFDICCAELGISIAVYMLRTGLSQSEQQISKNSVIVIDQAYCVDDRFLMPSQHQTICRVCRNDALAAKS